jgi:hypothetical protein
MRAYGMFLDVTSAIFLCNCNWILIHIILLTVWRKRNIISWICNTFCSFAPMAFHLHSQSSLIKRNETNWEYTYTYQWSGVLSSHSCKAKHTGSVFQSVKKILSWVFVTYCSTVSNCRNWFLRLSPARRTRLPLQAASINPSTAVNRLVKRNFWQLRPLLPFELVRGNWLILTGLAQHCRQLIRWEVWTAGCKWFGTVFERKAYNYVQLLTVRLKATWIVNVSATVIDRINSNKGLVLLIIYSYILRLQFLLSLLLLLPLLLLLLILRRIGILQSVYGVWRSAVTAPLILSYGIRCRRKVSFTPPSLCCGGQAPSTH